MRPWSVTLVTNSSRGIACNACKLNASNFDRSNFAGVFTTRGRSKWLFRNSRSNFSKSPPGLHPLRDKKLQMTSGKYPDRRKSSTLISGSITPKAEARAPADARSNCVFLSLIHAEKSVGSTVSAGGAVIPRSAIALRRTLSLSRLDIFDPSGLKISGK